MLLQRCLPAVFLVMVGAGNAWGQAAAEYGGVTSKAGATAASTRLFKPSTASPAPAASPSLHIPARTGEATEVANRRALEEHAGPNAAKLSLRSAPDHAQVWIDGQFVGFTPLELTLAPGRYQVEMQGARMEWGRQQLELLPKQSREVVVSLQPRYPKKVALR